MLLCPNTLSLNVPSIDYCLNKKIIIVENENIIVFANWCFDIFRHVTHVYINR